MNRCRTEMKVSSPSPLKRPSKALVDIFPPAQLRNSAVADKRSSAIYLHGEGTAPDSISADQKLGVFPNASGDSSLLPEMIQKQARDLPSAQTAIRHKARVSELLGSIADLNMAMTIDPLL